MTDTSRLWPRFPNDPPNLQTRKDMNPTLIVSWFCTIFSVVVILIRLFGRWVRTEQLFREDKVMSVSIIPLLIRMGFAHVVLRWGTNNTVTTDLSEIDIQHRAMGSKMVLASRIFYAAYIWIAKVTVLEFTRRIIGKTWTRMYEIGTRIIYAFLALTFAAVVVSTLTECRPFDHYWQVVPDPGPACRSGAAQLLTMGVCDIVSDVVLMAFPIPIVLRSTMPVSKKISLVTLFLLSLVLIAVTAYRVPSVVDREFSQQYRSLLASLEILAATAVANAIAIGSFLRDKGVKKAKFRAASTEGSVLDRTNSTLTRTKSATIAQAHWGSDEDLVRDLGLTVMPSLRHASVVQPEVRQAGPAEPADVPIQQNIQPIENGNAGGRVDASWTFRRGSHRRRSSDISSISTNSSDLKMQPLSTVESANEPVSPGGTQLTSNKMSFFDVGGLMENPKSEQSSQDMISQQAPVNQPIHDVSRSRAFLSDVGGLFGTRNRRESEAIELPSTTNPRNMLAPSTAAAASPRRSRSRSPFARLSGSHRNSSDSPAVQPPENEDDADSFNFADAGGLLK